MVRRTTKKTKNNQQIKEEQVQKRRSSRLNKKLEVQKQEKQQSASEESVQMSKQKVKKKKKISKKQNERQNKKIKETKSIQESDSSKLDVQEFQFDEFSTNLQNLQDFLEVKEQNKIKILKQLDEVIKMQTQNIDIEQIQRNLVRNISIGFKDIFNEVFENFSSSFTKMANKIEDNLIEREVKKRNSSKIAQRKKKISKKLQAKNQNNSQDNQKTPQNGDIVQQEIEQKQGQQQASVNNDQQNENKDQDNVNMISQKSVQNEEETIKKINEEEENQNQLNVEEQEQKNKTEEDFQIQVVEDNNEEVNQETQQQVKEQENIKEVQQEIKQEDKLDQPEQEINQKNQINEQEQKSQNQDMIIEKDEQDQLDQVQEQNQNLNQQSQINQNQIQKNNQQEEAKIIQEVNIREEKVIEDPLKNEIFKIEVQNTIKNTIEPVVVQQSDQINNEQVEGIQKQQNEQIEEDKKSESDKQIQFDAFSLQLNQQINFIEMSQNIKQKVMYTTQEKNYFEQVWQTCQKQSILKDQNNLDSKVAALAMSKSNLSREILQKIWQYSSQYPTKISKKDFFFALKLIAIKQHNIPINEQNILSSNFMPKLDIKIAPQKILVQSGSFPQRNSFDQNAYILNQKTLMRIENYIDNRCKTAQKGILTKQESNDLFQDAAGLNQSDQQHLWNICDIGQKGYLNRAEFILALFFISQYKKKIKLPIALPHNLKLFLKNYKVKQNKSSERNLSKSKEKIIYQNKFEQNMNLLLKKILDQETLIKGQVQNQNGIILNDEKEISNLQKCLQESIEINRQIDEQNQLLKSIVEFVQINMFDKQKQVDNTIESQLVILEQFYIISQKILLKKKEFKKFQNQLQTYLQQNIQDVTRQNSIDDTMTKVFDKRVQTEIEISSQQQMKSINNESPFDDFFEPQQKQQEQLDQVKQEKDDQIKENQQQMEKQELEKEDQEKIKEMNDKLDACSHIARKDYGDNKKNNIKDNTNQTNLNEASIKTLEDQKSIKLKDEMIPEDFQEYDKDDMKKSVKSDDEFQIHKQDFQKKDDEFFINHELKGQRNNLRKSKES